MTRWIQAGIIGVDAGLCWVGDPCYCVTPDATEHPAPTWGEFCSKLFDEDDAPGIAKQFHYAAGHPGLGVCVTTRDGDGTYPVYVEKDAAGRILAVTVRFDGESPA